MAKLFTASNWIRSGLRNPNRISQPKLTEYIQMLERACRREPRSADLRTCLAIAQSVNGDVQASARSFELAIGADAKHFYARFRYAELLCRLRDFHRAEEETQKAIILASCNWELSMAFRQLEEVGDLLRETSGIPDCGQPLKSPALALFLVLTTLSVFMFCR